VDDLTVIFLDLQIKCGICIQNCSYIIKINQSSQQKSDEEVLG